jgi:hypothetical protein
MLSFIKKEAVFIISSVFALISMFFVLPSYEYANYIDFRVIGLLFILMSVVAGFQNIRAFDKISEIIINKINNTRKLVIVLWMLCFFMSMFITNDVALITFVPLSLVTLKKINKDKYIIYTIVLQTIAANLGSMLTPMGNPQNLYLYTYFNIDTFEFFSITIPVILVSFALLFIISLYVKPEKIEIQTYKADFQKTKLLYIYFGLAIISLMAVFKVIDYRYVLVITVLIELIFDKKILLNIDWFLLLTFIAFFIFVGNIGQIDLISNTVKNIINGREMIVTLLFSQVISNVPAAVMLSGFTDNYRDLVLGSDIGGLGTLVASLASLISFKIYSQVDNCDIKKYLIVFLAVNIIFIIILLTVFGFCYTI